jgi:hypothetical protein
MLGGQAVDGLANHCVGANGPAQKFEREKPRENTDAQPPPQGQLVSSA